MKTARITARRKSCPGAAGGRLHRPVGRPDLLGRRGDGLERKQRFAEAAASRDKWNAMLASNTAHLARLLKAGPIRASRPALGGQSS